MPGQVLYRKGYKLQSIKRSPWEKALDIILLRKSDTKAITQFCQKNYALKKVTLVSF